LWAALTLYLFGWVPAEDLPAYEAMYNTMTTIALPTSLAALGFKRHVEARNVSSRTDAY
jgi:hypothetical protein